MAGTRQSHYVQARYLDGFLAPSSERLWCYGRKRPEPFTKIPDDLAHQRDFYRLPYGSPNSNLESFLETCVETPGLAALRKLLSTKRQLDIDDRINLAKYIAFQEMRVPYTRELTREHISHSNKHLLKRFQETNGMEAMIEHVAVAEGPEVIGSESFHVTRDQLEAYIKEMEDNPKSYDIKSMIDLAYSLMMFYACMKWTILLARDTTAFLTSDCPVFRAFDEPGGNDALLRLDCSVCCPLSSRAMLVMSHDLESMRNEQEPAQKDEKQVMPATVFRTITDKGVMNFNKKIIDNSHLWCFAGIKHSWIVASMQQASKRKKPDFFAQNDMYGVRWSRSE